MRVATFEERSSRSKSSDRSLRERDLMSSLGCSIRRRVSSTPSFSTNYLDLSSYAVIPLISLTFTHNSTSVTSKNFGSSLYSLYCILISRTLSISSIYFSTSISPTSFSGTSILIMADYYNTTFLDSEFKFEDDQRLL